MQLNQKTNGLILANGSKELFDNIDTSKVKFVVMVIVNGEPNGSSHRQARTHSHTKRNQR